MDKKCEHCFCKETQDNHITCCMCGTRKLKNPVRF